MTDENQRHTEKMRKIKAARDSDACNAALAEVERCAKEGGNLLAAAVEAARARATVGEISMAMEKVFGRHRAEVKTLAGVYGAAYEGMTALRRSSNPSKTLRPTKGVARVCSWSRWGRTGMIAVQK